ncbi:hypothetical protein Tco_0621319, partial [Tanacetum coccineum]
MVVMSGDENGIGGVEELVHAEMVLEQHLVEVDLHQ